MNKKKKAQAQYLLLLKVKENKGHCDSDFRKMLGLKCKDCLIYKTMKLGHTTPNGNSYNLDSPDCQTHKTHKTVNKILKTLSVESLLN